MVCPASPQSLCQCSTDFSFAPQAKNEGLFHLCEFIEDCEFTSLATRVLHLLGECFKPARYYPLFLF